MDDALHHFPAGFPINKLGYGIRLYVNVPVTGALLLSKRVGHCDSEECAMRTCASDLWHRPFAIDKARCFGLWGSYAWSRAVCIDCIMASEQQSRPEPE